MRPKLIVRLLISIILIALFALGLGMVAISLGLVNPYILYAVVEWPYLSFVNALITACAGAVLAVLSIVLISGLNRRRNRKDNQAAAVIYRGELGTSSITLAALDEMVRRHCAGNPAIKSTDASIAVKEDKLSIALKLGVAPDANVAAVTATLRETLVAYLQETTGITVADVGIMVATVPEEKTANAKA